MATAIEETLQGTRERDLALVLISGGSALLPAPGEDVALKEKGVATRLPKEAGADIGEAREVAEVHAAMACEFVASDL